MLKVLIVSREPRLVDAIRSNLGSGVDATTVATADAAQQELYRENFAFAVLDSDAMKGLNIQTIVAIDGVLQQERTPAVVLSRQGSADPARIKEQMPSVALVIDMSQGRATFDREMKEFAEEALSKAAHGPSPDGQASKELDLPPMEGGSLAEMPLTRILYSLMQRKESGTLELKIGKNTDLFAFSNGELVEAEGFASLKLLLGSFAWSTGKFAFEEGAGPEGTTHNPLEIIAEGCRDHVRQRSITEAMSEIMRRYPVPTNLWAEREELLAGWESLMVLMSHVDGSTTWERALSEMGEKVNEGFRAAYFALMVDIVAMKEQAGFQNVTVNYSKAVRRARQKQDEEAIKQTKAFQATQDESRTKLETELMAAVARMKQQTPHEIFGVWEGCGKKVVQERFYVLVKENHPDVYGGNTSGKVRQYAQDVFIRIKDAYVELQALEKEQTVADPSAKGSAPKPKTASSAGASAKSEAKDGDSHGSEAEEEEPLDVKERMKQLSGFRRKHARRRRMSNAGGKLVDSSEASDSEVSEPKEEPEPSEPSEPEIDEETQKAEDRKAKLNNLLKRAQDSNPNAPNAARTAFHNGYTAFREKRHEDALPFFEEALALEPKDGLYMTFTAYLRFLREPNKVKESESMLRDALDTGHRQAMPDTFLFLGHVLKRQGNLEEALKYFERALRLNPTSKEAEREVGQMRQRMGIKEKKPEDEGLLKSLFKK